MIQPKRVLHLVPSLHVGGVGRLLVNTAAGLDRDRYLPSVAYFAPPTHLADQLSELDVPLVWLRHGGRSQGLSTLSRLRRVIRDRRVDLIHTHLALDRVYGGLAAYLEDVPMVTTLHWTESVESRGSFGRYGLRRAAMGFVARHATAHFVAVSRAVKVHQVAELRIPGERISVVYSGIDCDAIRDAAASSPHKRLRSELGLAPETRVLLSVGRLVPSKGHGFLIEAVHNLPDDVVVLVAGEGPERTTLEGVIRSEGLGSRVRLLGNRDDVPHLLGMANAFAFPSLSEGLGIAAIEALAAGTPIVASRIPALQEFIDGSNGLLVEPANPQALAEEVNRILTQPALAGSLSVEGRRSAVLRFGLSRAARELESIYDEVLERGPR